MSIDYRTSDAVITICQNNKAQSVTITEINESAKDITGFSVEELVGKPLNMILPARIVELMNEYVEFDPDANDVGAVLSKVRSFSIVSRDGNENGYRVRVVRQSSTDNMMFFSLVLQNTVGARKNEATRKIIQDNFKGHESLDRQTDLPDRSSMIKDIGVMKRYNSREMLSCFAMLQVDNYDKLLAEHGQSIFIEILKHVAFIAKRSLRPDDVVGVVGDGRLGILLVDMVGGSERLVLNRLRWQIASNPYTSPGKNIVGLSVSISFCNIAENINERETLEQCELALDGLGSKSQNMLVNASV